MILNEIQVNALFFEMLSGAIDECFKTRLKRGENLVGNYESDGSTPGVDAELFDPAGVRMWHSPEPSGSFDTAADVEGLHKLCFKSTSSEVQTISFSMKVDHKHKKLIMKDQTDKIRNLVATLETGSTGILEQQQFSITREVVHQEVAQSTNSRVMWWTVVEVIALVLLSAFQVFYLQSYFEVKQVV